MRKTFLVLAVVGLSTIGAGAWSLSQVPRGALNQRRADNLLLKPSRPAYDPQSVQQTLEFWAKQAQSDPKGAIAQSMLARWYLESYRETGDIADALRAEKAARLSLALRPKNNDAALFQLSRSLLTQHRFREALTFAHRAALYNIESYRQCADIELELGDYKAAETDFAKVPRAQNDPSYLALLSRFHELKGRTSEQTILLQKAVKLADSNLDLPHQSVAWFHERLGHCLAMKGRFSEAERSYQAALDVFPRDYRTMAALAHLNANKKDWPQAIHWAQKAASIVPAPETIALLGDAYAANNENKEAERQYALIEDMGKLERAQGVIYDRQRALFSADHQRNLPEAVRLARSELKVRHDIYSYDTLAWVLYKSSRFAEAAQASQQALSQGTQDAALFYHAALIAQALRQSERARKYLIQVQRINPQFQLVGPHLINHNIAERKTQKL